VNTICSVSGFGAATALAGCVETVPEPGNSAEAQARAACVRDVRARTGASDVTVLRSEFSAAGTRVVLRVGPTGTRECRAYRNGATDRIMSLTNEGAL
jgi:pantoate kinase